MGYIATVFVAFSFGVGLIYLHMAVYEHPDLNLVCRYLLAVYGGFMGLKIYECVIEGRGKKVDGNTGGEDGEKF